MPPQVPAPDGITSRLLGDSSSSEALQSANSDIDLCDTAQGGKDEAGGKDNSIADISIHEEIDEMPSGLMHMDTNCESHTQSLPSLVPSTLNVPPLTHFQLIVQHNYPDLKSDLLLDSHGNEVLEITHHKVHNHPPAGYIHRTRIVLFKNSSGDGYQFDFQVLLESVKVGLIVSDEEFTGLCDELLRSKGFVFCPGIDYKDYQDNYYSIIRFHIKQVNLAERPFQRVDSKRCLRWFKLPKNATLEEQSSNEALCSACKRLRRDLEHQKKRSSAVSPQRRTNRQAASSNYPAKYLSPASVEERKKNTQAERSKHKALLSKYTKFDVTLDDSQHDEMCKITAELDNNHKDHLEAVYKEGGCSESALRSIWGADKQRAEFYKDQAKNGISCGLLYILKMVICCL